MDFFFDQEHLNLRTRIHSWVDEHLISAPESDLDINGQAQKLVSCLGQEGFIAHTVPKKFGGVRESVQARDLCLLRDELARGSALADTMFAMQALGSYPITLAGNHEQKRRYLPAVATGEAIAAFALTEPQAGSDILSMETRAVRHGGDYCLTGVKRFISNAGIARTYTVFAMTDPDDRHKGMSAFVVQADTPGFVFKESIPLISPHPIGVIAFEDCRIPEDQILGQEGDGLKIALATLDTLRCTVGAAAVGLAQRALDEAIRYSQSRRQFGHELAHFQAIQFKIAEMAAELEASRLLVYQAAWINDHGKPGLKEKSSIAKLFATEAAQRIVDQALQIHGGSGVVAGAVVERLYRDVRALRIYEGTSEVQKLVIAKELLKKGKS
ncbi:MAG: acyl-CoA dehydrogenase family protein [Deltaproteobacteria bacterium]|nr:acyl-CoA dehydrogenase family protein [Deltaproteobacteria bacterium]